MYLHGSTHTEGVTTMTITVRYGADLELGASQFDDLDVDATNAAYTQMIAEHLQAAYPDADVDVSYDAHNVIGYGQRLFVDGLDEDAVDQTLSQIEAQALAGDYGIYAREVA